MENLFEKYPDIVNVKQMAEMLQIGRAFAYKLMQTGAIAARKIGRDYKIPKKTVIEFLFKTGEN